MPKKADFKKMLKDCQGCKHNRKECPLKTILEAFTDVAPSEGIAILNILTGDGVFKDRQCRMRI